MNCNHRGGVVRVGPYTVYVGGTQYLQPEDLRSFDVLVTLNGKLPRFEFGRKYEVLCLELVDFGGVPEDWEPTLREQVIPLLESGKHLLAFCTASHGRTGTFLASLVALLESREETSDPIAAVRKRHCSHAVETRAQAEAIFALRGEHLPRKYQKEFGARPKVAWTELHLK